MAAVLCQYENPTSCCNSRPNTNVAPYHRNDLKTFIDSVQLSNHIAKENMEQHLEINKYRYANKAKDQQFRIGQYVWLYDPAVPVGHCSKMHQKWCSPYTISEVNDNNTFRIRHFQTHIEPPTLINGARLKPAKLHQESVIQEHCNEQNCLQGIPVIPDGNHRQNIPDDEAADDNFDEPEPLPPGEKVVDLCRTWYRVKFQGLKGTKWIKDGFLNVPQKLFDECLTKRTWHGTASKRKRK